MFVESPCFPFDQPEVGNHAHQSTLFHYKIQWSSSCDKLGKLFGQPIIHLRFPDFIFAIYFWFPFYNPGIVFFFKLQKIFCFFSPFITVLTSFSPYIMYLYAGSSFPVARSDSWTTGLLFPRVDYLVLWYTFFLSLSNVMLLKWLKWLWRLGNAKRMWL